MEIVSVAHWILPPSQSTGILKRKMVAVCCGVGGGVTDLVDLSLLLLGREVFGLCHGDAPLGRVAQAEV